MLPNGWLDHRLIVTLNGRTDDDPSVAGKLRPAWDATGKWRKECRRFADDLGYDREDIWTWFRALAAMHEEEAPFSYARAVAEDSAYRSLVAIHDKRGQAPN